MDFDKPERSDELTTQLRAMDSQATVRVVVTVGGRTIARTADPLSAHLAGMPSSRPAGLPASRPPGMPTSRADWRRTLIETQTHANTAATAAVRSQLEALGLEVRGGTLMPVFVVEGSPDAIQRVLDIDGIASVELDQDVSVNPSPMRP